MGPLSLTLTQQLLLRDKRRIFTLSFAFWRKYTFWFYSINLKVIYRFFEKKTQTKNAFLSKPCEASLEPYSLHATRRDVQRRRWRRRRCKRRRTRAGICASRRQDPRHRKGATRRSQAEFKKRRCRSGLRKRQRLPRRGTQRTHGEGEGACVYV